MIEESTRNVHFDRVHCGVKFSVCAPDGAALYVFEARLPTDEAGDAAYDYSGAFDCRLYPVRELSHYPSLLQNVRNATADWQTDGRFVREELTGIAGANETRRIVQRSRVRGMLVQIEVGNVRKHAASGDLESFDAQFSFTNDPAATSDIAAP